MGCVTGDSRDELKLLNSGKTKSPQTKASGKVARSSRDGEVVYRSLELPTWMFDRATRAPMRMDTRPWVNVAALDALTTLLAELGSTDAKPSNAPKRRESPHARYCKPITVSIEWADYSRPPTRSRHM